MTRRSSLKAVRRPAVLIIGLLVMILPGCSTRPVSESGYTPPPSEGPLPDLKINRVTYESRGPSMRLGGMGTNTLLWNYEFRVEVENRGSAPFGEYFFLSLTTSIQDYQNHMYSAHRQLNDAGTVIEPGKFFVFMIDAELEIPRQPLPTTFPVRFLINTEGRESSLGLPPPTIREIDYRNNDYELSMRLRLR